MSEATDRGPSTPSPVRLLRTKLFVPQAHPGLVARPRLLVRLDESLHHKLTLISAPAGFGKTTLLSAWIAQRRLAVGWVSLDERDSDPARFWAYVIAALQTVWPGMGGSSLAMLQSPQMPPIEGVLVELLNEVAVQAGSMVLILDDYHVIAEPAIHQGIGFLLDHLPAQLSVIISGRADPPLALAALRARRQLLEVRAPELRFTPEEAETFYNRVMGLALGGDDVAALGALTEGWAAGLQLAALSLQEMEDAGTRSAQAFVASFSGSHRYVFDYLAQEVLARQPPEVREFLLKTSLLTRMSAALCDAVVGAEDSQTMLERLEKANLFVVPLDSERHWYRYHHLFASFLRARLDDEVPPTVVAELHLRASTWYETHDALPDAIDHALAAGDYARVAALIKSVAYEMFRRSELRTLLAWLSELPQAWVRGDGFLAMTAAWAGLALGRIDAVEPHLKDVEGLLGARADGSPESFEHSPAIRGVLGEISCLRASLAFNTMDFAMVRALCDQARAYLGAGDDASVAEVPGGLFNDRMSLLGVAAFNLAITQTYSGETQAAIETFKEAIELSRVDGNPHLLPMCISYLAQLQVLQGSLRAGARSYREAVREIGGWRVRSPLSGMAYTGLGWVTYEWNDLARAAELLQQGVDLGRQWSHWEILLAGYSGLAHIEMARGDAGAADRWLQTLSGILDCMSMQWGNPGLEAYRALLAVRRADLETAGAWAETVSLPEEGPVPYMLELYALILARVWLAQGRLDAALRLLDRLIAEAQPAGRGGRVIEALTVRALVLEARDDGAGALASLARALEMAEPERYVRVFVDEGAAMRALLSRLAGRSEYAAQLLTAFGATVKDASQATPPLSLAGAEALLDPLTDRELEVLALMAQGLANQEIADRLVVSINTVKSHAKSIYDKLDARNRAQAVLRATELHLL